MFAFRVKHLIVVCFFSAVYLFFSSFQEPDITPVNSVVDERDAIDRFIDKYISEVPEDVYVQEYSATTEETLAYFYSENDVDNTNGRDDYDDEETLTQLDDNDDTGYDDYGDYEGKIDAVIHRSQPRVVSDENVSDQKDNDPKEPLKNDLDVAPPKARPKKFFTPKGKNKNFSAFKSEKSPSNSHKTYHQTDKNIKEPPEEDPTLVDVQDSHPPLPDVPPISLTINKALQDEMKRESPIVVLPKDAYWPPVLESSDAKIFSEIDYSKYDPEDRAYLLGRVGVYEERARAVGEVCRNNPQLIAPTPVNTFVWDQRHDPNIVWCEISKVASTSWMVNFLRLGHYRENDTSLSHLSSEEKDAVRFDTQLEDDNLHFKVFRLFPAPNTTLERHQIFSNALRFTIVRHPLARLLSAYLDKMTTLNPIPKIYNFRQLQLDIIERYRGNKTVVPSGDPQFPTFSEFIQHVIDSTAGLQTLKDWRKVVCWQPYWAKCGVCAHDFQMIMKLETMVDDEHFLVTLAGLRELDKVFEWRHSRLTDVSREEYFKQLSIEQMRLLHERYLLDFQLFGYSIHQYLELAYDAPQNNDART